MAYPPSPPALGKVNTTPQVDDHPAHHNALAQAIRDIVDILGTDPSGDYATLTEWLTADVVPGRHHYLNFVVKAAAPGNPLDYTAWTTLITTVPDIYPLNPDSNWHMYVWDGIASYGMFRIAPGPDDDPLGVRQTIWVATDWLPKADDVYTSRIHNDLTAGPATFNQHRIWYVGNDNGPKAPHYVTFQGVTHSYTDAASAAPVHPITTAAQSLCWGDTGYIGATTENFEITIFDPPEPLDQATGRINLLRENLDHNVTVSATVDGVANPEVPLGASSILSVHDGSNWVYKWELQYVSAEAASPATEAVISDDYTVPADVGFVWGTTGDGEYTVTLPSGLTAVKEATVTYVGTGFIHLTSTIDLYAYDGNLVADIDMFPGDSITVTYSPTIDGWFVLRQTAGRVNVRTVTGVDTITHKFSDHVLLVDPTGAAGDSTVNLLDPADAIGRTITIRRGPDADPDDVVVSGHINDTPASTITLAAGQSTRLTSDGTTWFTV